jgi:hypothetical protein
MEVNLIIMQYWAYGKPVCAKTNLPGNVHCRLQIQSVIKYVLQRCHVMLFGRNTYSLRMNILQWYSGKECEDHMFLGNTFLPGYTVSHPIRHVLW